MYAYMETGGKQFKVTAGESVKVPLLEAEPGTEVTIEKVLAVIKEGGAVFGAPYVANASVKAEVVGSGKDKKVLVFKMKPRKKHRKLRGHRQGYTMLRIKQIQEGKAV
jgi:large subunit ribosomal protein L21